MLALQDETTLVVVLFAIAAGLSFATLMVWMSNRQKLREERLKVVQKAVENPSIDDATRREIVAALSADDQQRAQRMRSLGAMIRHWTPRIVITVGWLMMVFCGGMWLVLWGTDNHRGDFGLVGAAMAGLAMVSLPMALREYDRRSAGQTA